MIDLKNYGFTDRYMIDSAIEGCIPARVTQVHREMYRVISTYGESNARLKGSFFNITETSQDFPAVGDFVHIKYNERGDSQIIKVYQRKSKFSRPDYSGHSAGYVKTILEQL